MTTSLSVIVPVLNEAGNIPTVVKRLRQSLRDIDWEVIFVDDDSRDASRELLVALAREDPRVRVITRIGRRGLSSAVIEGALSSSARYLAVMDGDLPARQAAAGDARPPGTRPGRRRGGQPLPWRARAVSRRSAPGANA